MPVVRGHNRRSTVQRFISDTRGTIAIAFAVVVPLLFGVAAAGADIAFVHGHKTMLQDAVDAGVIAGARELSLSDTKRDNVDEIVKAVVEAYLTANRFDGTGAESEQGSLGIKTNVGGDPLQVTATVTEYVDTFFLPLFGMETAKVSAKATAQIAGRPNICVLALDPSEGDAVALRNSARVTGKRCAVFANSSHSEAVRSEASAKLKASYICSRGGTVGELANFDPIPITECPSFDDPLASRPEPEAGECVDNSLVLQGLIGVLLPGTYCGGLTLESGTQAVLSPGTYVFKDGPLIVEDGASLTGVGVGLYFTGDDAYFSFADKTLISLAAPITGPMAGMLMFESRSQPKTTTHKLMSNNAPLLLGTIYLPRGELQIDAQSPIAFESAYTAIVARLLRLEGAPHLVLNTDYDQTDVPVPKGIRGAGQPVTLVE